MARVTDLDRNEIAAHRAAGRGWQTLARMYGVNEGDLRKWGEGLERDLAAVAVLERPAPVDAGAGGLPSPGLPSRQAAASRSWTLTGRVLAWAKGRRWADLTSREVQHGLGMEMKIASATLSKMGRLGLLEVVGRERQAVGQQMTIWRVTDMGRRAAMGGQHAQG